MMAKKLLYLQVYFNSNDSEDIHGEVDRALEYLERAGFSLSHDVDGNIKYNLYDAKLSADVDVEDIYTDIYRKKEAF